MVSFRFSGAFLTCIFAFCLVFGNATQESCMTDGGYVDAEPCVFPFTYKKGRFAAIVRSCAETKSLGLVAYTDPRSPVQTPSELETNPELWCSTSTVYNFDSRSSRKQWGFCSCPTPQPSEAPSFAPSSSPTLSPTAAPTHPPTNTPTTTPTFLKTNSPTATPTNSPTERQTFAPSGGKQIDLQTNETSNYPTGSPSMSGGNEFQLDTLAPTTAEKSLSTLAPTTNFSFSTDQSYGENLEDGIVYSDLEYIQMMTLISSSAVYGVAILITLRALHLCAQHSMRFPFEDISSANVAARLSNNYDRAGTLGGCLSSGVGWREAAVLLNGSGKLPYLLFYSRFLSLGCALTSLGFLFNSSGGGSDFCLARSMLITYGIVGSIWGSLNTFFNIRPVKRTIAERQRLFHRTEEFLNTKLSPAAILIVEFGLFTLATLAGFSSLLLEVPDQAFLIAAGLTVGSAVISIIGPVLAAHTVWIGNDLQLLTPSIEKQILDLQEEQNKDEMVRTSSNELEGDTEDAVQSEKKNQEEKCSDTVTENPERADPLPFVPESRLASMQLHQPTSLRDQRLLSFQNGSAKHFSFNANSQHDRSQKHNTPVLYSFKARQLSVAQALLKTRGTWWISDIIFRLLSTLSAAGVAVFCFLSVDSVNLISCLLLGCVAAAASLVEFSRIVVDLVSFQRNRKHSILKDAKLDKAITERHDARDWEGLWNLSIEMVDVDNKEKSKTIITWKNSRAGRVLLSVEGVLVALFSGATLYFIWFQGSFPTTSFTITAYLSVPACVLIAVCFVYSYIANVGYAGGELRIPRDRISELFQRKMQKKNDITKDTFGFSELYQDSGDQFGDLTLDPSGVRVEEAHALDSDFNINVSFEEDEDSISLAGQNQSLHTSFGSTRSLMDLVRDHSSTTLKALKRATFRTPQPQTNTLNTSVFAGSCIGEEGEIENEYDLNQTQDLVRDLNDFNVTSDSFVADLNTGAMDSNGVITNSPESRANLTYTSALNLTLPGDSSSGTDLNLTDLNLLNYSSYDYKEEYDEYGSEEYDDEEEVVEARV